MTGEFDNLKAEEQEFTRKAEEPKLKVETMKVNSPGADALGLGGKDKDKGKKKKPDHDRERKQIILVIFLLLILLILSDY